MFFFQVDVVLALRLNMSCCRVVKEYSCFFAEYFYCTLATISKKFMKTKSGVNVKTIQLNRKQQDLIAYHEKIRRSRNN